MQPVSYFISASLFVVVFMVWLGKKTKKVKPKCTNWLVVFQILPSLVQKKRVHHVRVGPFAVNSQLQFSLRTSREKSHFIKISFLFFPGREKKETAQLEKRLLHLPEVCVVKKSTSVSYLANSCASFFSLCLVKKKRDWPASKRPRKKGYAVKFKESLPEQRILIKMTGKSLAKKLFPSLFMASLQKVGSWIGCLFFTSRQRSPSKADYSGPRLFWSTVNPVWRLIRSKFLLLS